MGGASRRAPFRSPWSGHVVRDLLSHSGSRAVRPCGSAVSGREAVRLSCLSYCVPSEESSVSFLSCTSHGLDSCLGREGEGGAVAGMSL